MIQNHDRYHRKSVRLQGYDYSRAGGYFITICAYQKEFLFGDIRDGCVVLNQYGAVVREEWLRTGILRNSVILDEFVIMPNHFHGILFIVDISRGTSRRAPTKEQFGKPVIGSIPTIINAFKSSATRRINKINGTSGIPVWQRNFYEHIIRDEQSLGQIREYIVNNPCRWNDDELFIN